MIDQAVLDFENALDILSQGERENDSIKFLAFFQKGICLRKQGKLPESIKDLEDAVKLQEKSSSAHNNLGLSFFESARYDDAITHYGKAIQNDIYNSKSVLLNNRGLAYYHSKKLDEAEKDFNDAISLDPTDATIFFNRGNAYLNWVPSLKKIDEAHSDYDQAISLAPDNPKIWHSKGLAYQSQAEHSLKQTGNKDLENIELAIECF